MQFRRPPAISIYYIKYNLMNKWMKKINVLHYDAWFLCAGAMHVCSFAGGATSAAHAS